MTDEVTGLNQEAWEMWVAYRKRIKKPLKPANYPWTQKGLAKFGKDQLAVVERSMEREWQGLFPLQDSDTVQEFDVKSFNPQAPW